MIQMVVLRLKWLLNDAKWGMTMTNIVIFFLNDDYNDVISKSTMTMAMTKMLSSIITPPLPLAPHPTQR